MTASKEELGAAMRRLFDALSCMRGPTGELIYVGEKALHIAWHLARAGADVNPQAAIIKRRPIPAGPGQIPGMVDWVPVDWPDPDPAEAAELVTAVGPLPDPSTFDDLLAWHTHTRFEGKFQ
jgi:hypothetical protein